LSDEILFKMLKKSLVLNVSDQKLDNTNVLLLEGNLVNFLEKYEFVPNQEWLDLTQLMRVNIQIILENSLETQFKAVELLEGSDEILSPLVCKMLDNVPVVTPDLTVSTKTDLDPITGVKIEQFVLTPESNLLLIVATKLLQNPTLLKQVLNSLQPKGFVLTREEVEFEISDLDHIKVVTEYQTAKEKLILFKKSEEKIETKFVEVLSNNSEWLPQLQNFVKSEANVVVYGQNREPDGLIGLVKCLRKEPGGHKVKCFFMMDKAPDFNPQVPFYKDQLRKNLAINIYKSGEWGTYLLLEELQEVECEHCFGDVSAKGDFSSIRWLEGPAIDESRLPETQVLIYVSAVYFI
jgi:fatty acid synthase